MSTEAIFMMIITIILVIGSFIGLAIFSSRQK